MFITKVLATKDRDNAFNKMACAFKFQKIIDATKELNSPVSSMVTRKMQQAASSLSPLIQRYNVHSRFQAKIIA
jgi:hypothetical protein